MAACRHAALASGVGQRAISSSTSSCPDGRHGGRTVCFARFELFVESGVSAAVSAVPAAARPLGARRLVPVCEATPDGARVDNKSLLCAQCQGNGAVACSQCKGKGVNDRDHFGGQFKAGRTCWLCSGKKEMLCGSCNGAGFLGGFLSTQDE